jgi:hypothetical protein
MGNYVKEVSLLFASKNVVFCVENEKELDKLQEHLSTLILQQIKGSRALVTKIRIIRFSRLNLKLVPFPTTRALH